MRILRLVLLLSRTGKYGGPADTALAQARLMADVGFEVAVLGGHLANDKLEDLPSDNVRVISELVHPLLRRVFFPSLFSLRMLRSLFVEIRSADLIHLSVSREMIPAIGGVLAIMFRKPLVIQPHGMLTGPSSRRTRVADLLIKGIFAQGSQVIALTNIERSALAGRYLCRDNRVWTIGNPIVADPAVVSEDCRQTEWAALFVARLHERKRLVDFVSAAKIAADQGWTDSYCFAGPDQGELARVRDELVSLPLLSYAGALQRQEIPAVLMLARCFVLCSGDEAWGNVLVLALASGVPCVVTRSTALAEEIERSGAGLVVDDENPGQIAQAVHDISSSEELWRELHANALALAERRLSDRNVSGVLENVYRAALSQT